MAGFEPRASGFRSNHSANYSTTTVQLLLCVKLFDMSLIKKSVYLTTYRTSKASMFAYEPNEEGRF